MYILVTPQEYPIICKMRRRSPGEKDQVSMTAKKSDGAFLFRELTEEEKRIERMQQSVMQAERENE
ncbi:MAG: hypothetical protein ISN29_11480 [Gammaproteobacteria bacterium AqS3]|nr:hypothetical protein [Gammaproteobacteria bacterium AqS3]